MVRRFVFWWFTSSSKPSGRDWARQLGIGHTWLQRVVREFQADPSEMWRLQELQGDPSFAQLEKARSETQRMREKG
ncbi:MAG: hypothetical protein M3O09_15260, partial [Acidobacteriota bacterium]|nr:hypothetical protein [Acidobacteriota bacterium]